MERQPLEQTLQTMETTVHGAWPVSTPLPASDAAGPAHRKPPDKQEAQSRLPKRLLRLLRNCLDALHRDEIEDRIDQIPQYRNARMDAHHYSLLRSNR
jgi:hypothetical protein